MTRSFMLHHPFGEYDLYPSSLSLVYFKITSDEINIIKIYARLVLHIFLLIILFFTDIEILLKVRARVDDHAIAFSDGMLDIRKDLA